LSTEIRCPGFLEFIHSNAGNQSSFPLKLQLSNKLIQSTYGIDANYLETLDKVIEPLFKFIYCDEFDFKHLRKNPEAITILLSIANHAHFQLTALTSLFTGSLTFETIAENRLVQEIQNYFKSLDWDSLKDKNGT
jgi:hypothetical protein